MRNRIRVVLDTNILLVSISSKSKYHWIFSNLLNNQYELYVTNDKHFDILKEIDFPKVNIVKIDVFEKMFFS